MTRYISLSLAAIISMVVLMGSLSALPPPPPTPSGETASGKFNSYFTNTYRSAGIFDSSPSYTNGCAAGQVVRGFTTQGMLLCISPYWSSTDGGINIYFTGAGNIGIGIATTTAKLQVASSNYAMHLGEGIGGAGIDFKNRLATIPSFGTLATIAWLESTSGLPAGSLLLSSRPGVGGVALVATGSTANLYVSPSSGNVGIGTIAPGARLEVAGQMKITGGNPGLGKVLTSDATGLASWTTSTSGDTTDNLVTNSDFEMGDMTGWGGGASVANVGSASSAGNYALVATGAQQIESTGYIPVAPTRDVLQLEGYFRKTTLGTTPGLLYFGYIAYDANKVAITTAPCGTYCYFAAAGTVVAADGIWHKYSATTTGESTAYPSFPVGTKYVRVLMLLNYAGSADTAIQVDHITLKRINYGPLFVGNNYNTTNLADQYQSSRLYTTATNNLILDSTGNVGIGTATPAAKLDVAGKTIVGVTTTDYLPASNNWNYTLQLNGLDTSSIGFHDLGNNVGSIRFKNNLFTIGADDGWGIANAYFPGNMGIGTATPTAKLDVNGDANISGTIRTNSGILNTNDYFEKVVTTPYFTNGTANLAVDLRLGNLAFWGNIEVEITSTFSYQNSAGKLTKVFAVGTNVNNLIYTNESRVSEALGTIPDNISIGDMSWDATNSIYRIPISHIVSTGNSYTIKVKMLTNGNGAKPVSDTMTVSPLYTLTALPRNYVNYNGNVGIGTATPGAKLDVSGDILVNGVTVGRGGGNIGINTANGAGALGSNTTGTHNTANGYQSLMFNTTGVANTANGPNSLRQNTIGNFNTAYGNQALAYSTVGSFNTANGVDSLISNITGNNNIAIGYSAGNNLLSGDSNIAIGSNTAFPSTTGSNQLNIGNWIYGTSGNIGIGTNAPTSRLDVMGAYGDPSLLVNSPATANFRTPGHVQLAINTSLTSPYTTSLQAKHSTLDGNAYPISLNPLGGNIGIGTTTPGAKLDVNGTSIFNGAMSIQAQYPIAFTNGQTIRDNGVGGLDLNVPNYSLNLKSGTDPSAVIGFYTNNLPRVTILNGGNVGIGTSTPNTELEVLASGSTTVDNIAGFFNPVVGTSAMGNGAAILLGNTKAGYYNKIATVFEQSNPSFLNPALVFYTMNNTNLPGTETEKMRITSAGNIGIGTTTPTAKLEVNGQVKITGGTPGAGKVLTSDAAGLASWMSPSDMPIGAVVAFSTATCPTGWVAADGSGAIDLRGEFIRGLDSGRGVDVGRVLGTAQVDMFKSHTHNSSVYGPGGAAAYLATTYNSYFDATTQVTGATGGAETRPRNVALLYCTKISSSTSTVSNNLTWSNVTGTSTGDVTLATTGNVGVGTTAPTAKLEINGQVKITGGAPAVGKVLTSDAVGLATWATAGYPCIPAGTGFGNNCYGRRGSQLSSNTTGLNNTAIGDYTLSANTIGQGNTAVGVNTLMTNTSGHYNTANGVDALRLNITGQNNIAFGNWALSSNTIGNWNSALGYGALSSLNSGNSNTTLGAYAGSDLISGASNIIIGYNTQLTSTTASNQLNIGNWIYGQGGNIGIGTGTALTAKLTVAGQVQITGGVPGVGKILTSDATGLASWENPSDMPIGAVVAFNTATCPTGWVAANGSGTIDLRGEFIRGLDSGRGVDIGRVLGTAQVDMFKSHVHNYHNTGNPADINDSAYGNATEGVAGNTFVYNGSEVTRRSAAVQPTGGTETRPRNVALLYCTKISGVTSTLSSNVTWSNVTGTSTGDVTLATTGNVGVGTTGPTAKLEINSGIAGTSGLRFTNLTSTSATGATNGKMLTVNGSGDIILVDSPTLVTSNMVKLYGEAWNTAAGKINNTSGYSFTVSASGRYLFDFVSTSYASNAAKTTTFAVRNGTTVLASDSDTSFNNLVHVEYSGKVEVDLVAGTTYNVIVTDSGVKNSGDWERVYYKQVGGFASGGTGSSGMTDFPVGSVMAFNLATCPSGWVAADGTSSTPDLRGEFIRGLDSGRGVDIGRLLGTVQADGTRNHTHGFTALQDLNGGDGEYDHNGVSNVVGAHDQHPVGRTTGVIDAGGNGGSETRPRNVALLYCIKITGTPTLSNNVTWSNTTATSTGNVILATTGNVGIGTIAPGSPLEINSTVDNILRLRQQGGGWNYMEFYNDTVRTAYLGMDNSNNLSMNGKLFVNTISGNVGIGTSTPGTSVGMSGGLTINGTNATKITVEDNGVPAYALNTSTGAWTMFDKVGGTWNASLSSSGGKIGIGTTTPGGVLNVEGAYGLPGTSGIATTYNMLRLSNTTAHQTGAVMDFGNNGSVGGWLQSRSGGDYTVNYPLLLNPNGGNVGIGTSTPGVNLDVAGEIRTGRDGVAGSYDTTSSTTTQSIWSISPTYDLNGAAATAFGNLYGMSYSYQGNGGLAGFGHQIGFHDNGTRNAAISLTNGNAFFNGNVGIGTSAPAYKLDVVGDITSRNLVNVVNSFGNVNIGPQNASFMHFISDRPAFYMNKALHVDGIISKYGVANQWADINANSYMANNSIYSYGKICAGNSLGTCNGVGGFVADSAGNVTGTAFLYSSDRTLKRNIAPLSNSLSKIVSLNGYSFDWKSTGKHDIGVIAQEVEKIFPALVHTDSSSGIKSVEYGNLVAPIIEAIKELANTVKTHTTEINALKSENATLKARLDAIEARLAK